MKNLEFDLQIFALPANVTIQANSGGIYAAGVSDSASTSAESVDSVTSATTTTVTSSTEYYNFSNSVASVSSEAVSISSDTLVTISSSSKATDGTVSPTTVLRSDTVKANSTLPSPMWLTGGGVAVNSILLNTVGGASDSISSLANTTKVQLTQNGSNVYITGVEGTPLAVAPKNGVMDTTINGAAAKFTVTSGANVTINGGDVASKPTLQAEAVTIGTINDSQTWVVGSSKTLAYKNLQATATVDSLSATKSSTDDYVAVSVNSGAGVKFDTIATSSLTDTISVNNVILNNVGRTKAAITATNDTLMAANLSGAGTFAVGASAKGGAISVGITGANVAIESVSSGFAIRSVDLLAASGSWSVGNGAGAVALGNDTVNFSDNGGVIRADSTGTKASSFTLTGGNVTVGAVGDRTLAVGGSSWNVDVAENDSTLNAVFDATGNATVNSISLSAASANPNTMALSGGQARTLVAGAGSGDSLALKAGQSVVFTDSALVSSASGIVEGSNWLVKGGSGERAVAVGASDSSTSFRFAKATESVYGLLTASSSNGGSISAVSSLTGNVTVTAPSTISGLNVMGGVWTVGNAASGAVVFDSTGSGASLGSGSADLTVMAEKNATVTVAASGASTLGGYSLQGAFNVATITAHDGDGVVAVQLDSDSVTAGIAGITSLNSGATVKGDSHFKVNEKFDVTKLTNTDKGVQFTLGGSSSMTVENVIDGDSYNVSVASGSVYYDIKSTVASGGQAKVAVNSAEVTITATSDSNINNAYIVSKDSDAVVSVGGLKFNDKVDTKNDSIFGATFNKIGSATGTDTLTMSVNDVGVTLRADGIDSDASAVTMYVDKSAAGSKTHVTIAGGIAKGKESTITVGSGVYSVGASAVVTVNDSIGYLYVDTLGNVTAEDSVVAQIRIDRDKLFNDMVSSLNGGNTTVQAFKDFYNIYSPTTQAFDSSYGVVAGYSLAAVTTPSTIATNTTGVNIYGDDSLGGGTTGSFPRNITLQSYLSNPIDIEHIEGVRDGYTIRTAVVDVSSSTNELVAVGMNSDSAVFATNHTILGSNAKNSKILIGSKATGNNYIKGGNGGSLIYNNGGTASIYGGELSDTIYGAPSDHVEGGAGADYFYDTHSFEISDYSFEQGDVIVATKLSTSSNISPANLYLDGNKIAVAGGSTLTVGGADYDNATANKVIVANANAGNNTRLIWAGNYGTLLDATDVPKGGAVIISSLNGGAENTIIGSAGNDTIIAGPNDTINPGAGSDTISLAGASVSGQRGATITLTADSGKTEVYGWKGGFSADNGSNALLADNIDQITFKKKENAVVASASNASLNFNNMEAENGAYRFLINGTSVSFIAPDEVATVHTNADLSGYYKAEKSGGILVSDSVTTQFEVTLGSAKLANVNKVDIRSEGKATIWGSSANESIAVSGTADAGARKYVAAGLGYDTIVSGGNSTTAAGNNFYFGTYGNMTYSGGRTTISSFNYYKGKEIDGNCSSADLLYLGDFNNYKGVNVSSNRLEISLAGDESVIISDDFTTSNDNKDIRVQFGGNDKIYNIKFGVSSGSILNTFTYDGETDIYWGNTSRARDTLNLSNSANLSNYNIWLGDKAYDSVTYGGIGMINAGAVENAKLTLAGSESNNTIISGGNGTASSLWGGGGETNALFGNANGEETFFYFKKIGYTDSDGVARSSTDTLTTVGNEDLVWLYDVTLDDIDTDKTAISSGRIDVVLKNGGGVVVTGVGSETNFRLSDGNGGFQNVKSINTGSNRHWE